MKRFLGFVLAAALALAPASAQSPQVRAVLLGVGGPAAGGAVTTLDPANKGAAITLSGGNLTASNSNASNTDASVKSTVSHASGKFYFEVTVVAHNRELIGIGNASATLTGFVGSDANGIGLFASGVPFVNGSTLAGVSSYTTGDVVSVALDIGNSAIWFRTNASSWNANGSADPATNTGGISLTGNGVGAGPYFAIVSPANNSTTLTVNFGTTAYAQSKPSGFGNW